VRDDAGNPVGKNAVGEVCWRGANKTYGFLNDPEGTEAVWDASGWLNSGDLGTIDDEGYLRIVGRKKDMIIRGGQNINPRAIEEVLLRHPAVVDVAIAPVPDAVLGERVGAFVVGRPSGSRRSKRSRGSCRSKGSPSGIDRNCSSWSMTCREMPAARSTRHCCSSCTATTRRLGERPAGRYQQLTKSPPRDAGGVGNGRSRECLKAGYGHSRMAVSPDCVRARLSRKISGKATSATSIISLKSSA
jgi:acyl-CoA synthetase (AMP-forming)/AMP-acid ligase II